MSGRGSVVDEGIRVLEFNPAHTDIFLNSIS